MKKIAIICNYELLSNRIGGMDYFYLYFDAACKKLGHEIIWFFPNQPQFDFYKDHTIINSNYQNIESFFVGYISNHKLNFDYIFTHFVELCTPTFKKIKKIYPSIIISVDHNPRPLGGYSFKKRMEKKIKGILYQKYIDLFVGVSAYTINEICKDFGKQTKNKCLVIYNGINHDKIQIKLDGRKGVKFITTSHLRHSKGIQDLITAVNNLDETLKNSIQISCYGDGEYRSFLEEMVSQYKLNHIIHFLGSSSELFQIYHKYDYMIQPSYMECFSLAILESLSANVPVIATSVGGNQEVLKHGENGFIFEPKDVNTLKNILENVILGKLKINQNVSDAVRNNFSIENMVNQYMALIK